MKRIIRTITILAFAVVSCQKVDNEADLDPVNPSGPKRVNLVITAQAGGEGGTRTQLLDDDRVHWLPSEEINVFSAGEMAQFHSTNTERTGYARFVGSISVMTEPQEGEDADVWALYPYYADATLAAGVLTTTLPSTQFGVDGTFADDLVIAAARKVNPFIDLDREGSMGVNAAGSNLPTLALDMNFWNVCSGMWFTVDRSDITSVTMTATGGEPIAGTFSFDFDADGFPRVRSVSAPSSSITLTAPDGGAFTPGVKYYFVTLPVTFSQGVTFDFVTDTMVGTRTIRSAFSLERSIFSWKEHLDAPVSFIPDPDATHVGDFDFETHSVEYHEEFRAMWVATVKRIDFPAAAQGDAVAQRAELVDLFQDIKRMGFNAIVFQVNPMADAFWNSELLPWSMYLTGTQGEDPGYDPLELAVEIAHSLGLELHAWFNPLRIGPVVDVRSETHPMFSHPDWYQTYSGSYYWNPGIPEVRTFLGEIMREVVTNYDVDGTHIDDYFYPSGLQSNKRTWDDSEQFAEYGGNYSLYNWRVHNIDLMVQNYQAVTHAAKAHVVFGAAPGATESYAHSLYSYPTHWLSAGTVDYISPQIYWDHDRSDSSNFDRVLDMWLSYDRDPCCPLMPGLAPYMVYDAGTNFYFYHHPEEMLYQVEDLRAHQADGKNTPGSIWFRARYCQRPLLTDYIPQNVYPDEVLAPVITQNPVSLPAPNLVSVTGTTMTWSEVQGADNYVVLELTRRSSTATVWDAAVAHSGTELSFTGASGKYYIVLARSGSKRSTYNNVVYLPN